jgi:hypothetical protein
MPQTDVAVSAKAIVALLKAGYLREDDLDNRIAIGAAITRLLDDMVEGRLTFGIHRGRPKKTVAAAIRALLDDFADDVLKRSN